jgi:tetratricopeptide (TPR) repeat protein
MYLGLVYNITGRDRLAEQAMRKAVTDNPERGEVHQHLAQHYYMQGRLADGLRVLKPALKIQDRQRRLGDRDPQIRAGLIPQTGAHATHGMLLLAMGRTKQARAALQKELDQARSLVHFWRDTVAVQTLIALSHAHRRLGNAKQAAAVRKKGVAALGAMLKPMRDPSFPLTNTVEGLIVFEPKLVLSLLDRWAKPSPLFDDYYSLLRAAAHLRLGHKARAARLYKQSLRTKQKEFRCGSEASYKRFRSQFAAADRHRASTKK